MDNFIVSARKYRPQTFSTVVGQAHITTTLKNAIVHGQLAHAFLFTGPRGVGKTTCARILAKTINCDSITKEGEACDKCSSCISFNNGQSFNVHELDAASNNSVDDIRDLIDQVRFAPQAGKYKVYIIDEVHMLSASAFNAFLKTLEEPPAHAIFILATTEKHKIIPTILSRCQIFDFKRITSVDITEHLEEIAKKESIKAENTALQLIAQKSDGCMRDALSMLDKIVSFTNASLTYSNTLEHLNVLDEDYFFRFLNEFEKEDLPAVLNLYDEIDKKGFEGDMFLNNFSEFFRNLLVARDPRSIKIINTVEEFKQKYADKAGMISASYIIGALNILNDAEIGFKQARNKRLHVEFHLIRLTHLSQAVTLLADGTLQKKKQVDGLKTVAYRNIRFTSFKTQSEKSDKKESESSALVVNENNAPAQKATLKIKDDIQQSKESTATENNIQDQQTAQIGLGALKKIREQIQHKKQERGDAVTLTLEKLNEDWNEYLSQLLEKNQVTSHTNLSQAILKISDKDQIEIVASSRIQYQFIENERIQILSYLNERFNNNRLQIHIILEQSEEEANKMPEITLSQKDQYLKMISLYPLVKDLKDKLNMDLDY
jgi:DNA polymerase-3 subunit gamma/tau